MAGLVPAIHVYKTLCESNVDVRHKPGMTKA
jgi:hypothetical protein